MRNEVEEARKKVNRKKVDSVWRNGELQSFSSYLFSSPKGKGQSLGESGSVAGAEGVASAQAWVVEGGW